MCGLVGVIAKRTWGFVPRDILSFSQMLYADALRGFDSTGVITVMNDRDFYIDKEASEATNFLVELYKSDSQKNVNANGLALLGHNRKSTVGATTDRTAHPFVVKNHFAMMHNGTLYNHKKIADTEVDSEALAILLERTVNDDLYDKGLLEDALEDVSGAYACVWYNQKTHQVEMLRNSERPLIIVETSDCWFYGSELKMIEWILDRNNIKVSSVIHVPFHTLFTFTLGETTTKMTEVSLEVKKPTPLGQIRGTTIITSTVVSTKNDYVSKNEFKRLRNSLLNTIVNFTVYNYKEKFPTQPNTDYYVEGFADELINHKHVVYGEISIEDNQVYDIVYLDSFAFIGTISDMQYNKATGTIHVFLKKVYSNNQKEFYDGKTTVALH